ncbi:unnamed protein product, partial [Allacma fusca]
MLSLFLKHKCIYCIFILFHLGHSLKLESNDVFNTEFEEPRKQDTVSSFQELHSAEYEQHLPQELSEAEYERAINYYSYSSVQGLKSLVKLEFKIYETISALYRRLFNRTDSENRSRLQIYLQDYEETTGKLLEDFEHINVHKVEKVSWNIIASYRMLRRFHFHIIQWVTFPPEDKLVREVLSFLKTVYAPEDGPTEGDFENAMVAVANIHFTYGLSAKNISEGKLMGEDTGITLQSVHCYEIGNAAISMGYLQVGIEWLELAKEKVNSCSDATMKIEEIEVALELAQNTHNKEYDNSTLEPQYFEGNLRDENLTKTQYGDLRGTEEQTINMFNHFGICAGKSHQ